MATAFLKENSSGATFMLAVQCKMARVALGWGIKELAKAANVSSNTISRFERGERLKDVSTRRLTPS